jgi:hypothetical protein
MTISSSVGRTQRVARGGLVVGLLATLVGAASLTTAPAASAAPAVVNVTVECPQPLSVTANVGDTIVFTFASSCNFDPGVNEWNLWNLNSADGSGRYGGFLSLLSTTATPYPNCPLDFSSCAFPPFYGNSDDWSVSSGTSVGITVTTILSALNGEPQPLAITPGAAIGVLGNEANDVVTPWSVAILWAGPRTSGDGSEPDMTLWHQSISRSSSDAACPSGYAASWAQWPNDHKGGWVCNRELFAYQPNPGA